MSDWADRTVFIVAGKVGLEGVGVGCVWGERAAVALWDERIVTAWLLLAALTAPVASHKFYYNYIKMA